MPVRTVASQCELKGKKNIYIYKCGILFCIRRIVLFTAFYAFLSLGSLFWVGNF